MGFSTMTRPLNSIAMEIVRLWKAKPPGSSYRFAMPYVEAMISMSSCKDMYGLEYGDMIVVRALDNMAQWRGDDARRIKAELNQHLKEYNDASNSGS